MATLNVQEIDETILSRLRNRAERHGISVEEEVRFIIREAVTGQERLGDMALRIFGPERGANLPLPDRQPHEPIELG